MIDLSLGGLFAAILKMIFVSLDCGSGSIGFRFKKNALAHLLSKNAASSYDEVLWGETAHSYLVSTGKNVSLNLDEIKSKNVDILLLGETTKQTSIFFSPEFEVNLQNVYEAWKGKLRSWISKDTILSY